jgi:hypothetical protein
LSAYAYQKPSSSVLAFLPAGEVVLGVDDTIERRWGPKIKARGLYRDPVRPSRGHFVRASGLRWLSLMVMVPISWAGRRWALPFLTVLAPSKRWSTERGRRHKTVVDWAHQAVLQAKRWLSDRRLAVVADAGFSGVGLIAALRRHACLVTRLRIDASPFAPAGADGPPATERAALADVQGGVGRPSPRMVTRHHDGVVWRLVARAGGRFRYRGLVPTPACRLRRSVGCWCVTLLASANRRRF